MLIMILQIMMILNQENLPEKAVKVKLILVNFLHQSYTHGIRNKVKSLNLVKVEVESQNVLVNHLLIVFNVKPRNIRKR